MSFEKKTGIIEEELAKAGFDESRQVFDGEDLAEASGSDPGEVDDRKLFATDHGRLPLRVRIVLARLLKGPYLDRSKPELWTAMMTFETAIRRWLGEVFLELVIDHDDGVAFTKQLRPSELPEKAPILLRPVRLTYFEAALLLILRKTQQDAIHLGERAVISLSRDDVKEMLTLHRKSGDTNLVTSEAHANAVIRKFEKDYKILKKLKSTTESYEIAPVIKFLVTPRLIGELISEFDIKLAKSDETITAVFGGDDVVIERRGGEWPELGLAPLGDELASLARRQDAPLIDPLTEGPMPDTVGDRLMSLDDDDDEDDGGYNLDAGGGAPGFSGGGLGDNAHGEDDSEDDDYDED